MGVVVLPFCLRRVVGSSAAFRWRFGVVCSLRCEAVLSSGALVVSSVRVGSFRAACCRARAVCAGSGVLRCSLFLPDGRWVCSALA